MGAAAVGNLEGEELRGERSWGDWSSIALSIGSCG